MNKDFKVYLDDMITAINEVEKSTVDVSFEDFASNYEKINSVAYDVLIIGEAVDKIPKSVQENNPQIPWRVLNDIRNKHIHEYHTVKPDKLWKMAKLSLPKVKKLLEDLLRTI
ncbi:MAG TPA: HepT-like ribonuclease domain-containing protein [Candidatus Bathyarchaeia archaeon]